MNTTTTNGVPIAVTYRNGKEWVDARDLHGAMSVPKDYTSWIKYRIDQYKLVEGDDYEVFTKIGENPLGGRPATEYALTLDTAKELAMIENNDSGRAIRKYFIGVERGARELAANLRELGIDHVETYAVAGYVYSLFMTSPDMTVQKINRILYYLSVRPRLTNADIAKLVGASDASIHLWRKRLPDALVAKATERLAIVPSGNSMALRMSLPEPEKEAADAQ